MSNNTDSRTATHVLPCLRNQSNGQAPPPFFPAIYEHKGFFINETPSAISRSGDLLAKGVLAEYEALKPDALTIGIDVYNLEAEAAGCKVTFYEGDDISIPGINPSNHIIKMGDDISCLQQANPLTAGRMPVNIEAARQVVKAVGNDVWVRGAISGPFSLAVSLIGAEPLFMATLDDPDFVHALLKYSVDLIKDFGKAYIDVGADVILFDSQASADLLPPEMYDAFILEPMKELIRYFKEQGVADVPLVIGGTTTPMIDTLIDTGANNLLCDYNCDWPLWYEACKAKNLAVRRNIDSNFIKHSTPDKIYEVAKKYIEESQRYAGYIMGTAVIPYGTENENLLAIKQACIDSVND